MEVAQVQAHLFVEPKQVEIGQPLDWMLAISHPADVAVRVSLDDPAPDGSWVLIESGRKFSRQDPLVPALARTEVHWKLCSLESGERNLPALSVSFDQDGIPSSVIATAETVMVESALGEGEDTSRPARGFRPAIDGDLPDSATWMVLAPIGLVVIGLTIFLLRRRRRPAAPAPPPTPSQRLAELEACRDDDPQAAKMLYFELSRTVREAVDRRYPPADDSPSEEAPNSLTDEEWLQRVRSARELPSGVPDTLEALLKGWELVKYGQTIPTRFAVDEALGGARKVVESLEEASDPARGSGQGTGGA